MGPHEPEPSEPRGFRSIMILIRAATGNKQLIILRIHRSKLLFICSQLSDSSRTSGPAHLETWSRIRLSRRTRTYSPDIGAADFTHHCVVSTHAAVCLRLIYTHSMTAAVQEVRSGPVQSGFMTEEHEDKRMLMRGVINSAGQASFKIITYLYLIFFSFS